MYLFIYLIFLRFCCLWKASPFAQTSCLEDFYSLLNQFASKMIACSHAGLYCRYRELLFVKSRVSACYHPLSPFPCRMNAYWCFLLYHFSFVGPIWLSDSRLNSHVILFIFSNISLWQCIFILNFKGRLSAKRVMEQRGYRFLTLNSKMEKRLSNVRITPDFGKCKACCM